MDMSFAEAAAQAFEQHQKRIAELMKNPDLNADELKMLNMQLQQQYDVLSAVLQQQQKLIQQMAQRIGR